MAQKVLWIRLEDKESATKYPITGGNMSHDLDDLAADLCKQGRLKTLKLARDDLQFLGDYDRTQYGGDGDGDGRPLRSGIQLQHLKTTDTSPLVVRFPLSDKSSKSNYF